MYVAMKDAIPHFIEYKSDDQLLIIYILILSEFNCHHLISKQQLFIIFCLESNNHNQKYQSLPYSNMNYLKNSLRVKMNLTNPYKIKPQYCIFPQSATATLSQFPPLSATKIAAKLIGKQSLGPEYNVLRFNFLNKQHQNKCLGLTIGQYIWIEINGQKRPYVPISRIDQLGYVDILVRDMRGKNLASFTHKLFTLQENTEVSISGPGTQFLYQGFGKLTYHNTDEQKTKTKKYKNIGIITHSSAITTTYSLIESVMSNYDHQTGLSLLWVGDSQQDFIFVQEFAAYAEQCKLNVNLMLTGKEKEKNWLGPYGRVLEYHIKEFMPFVDSKQVIIMSGLEGQLAEIPNLIKKMGYKDYLIF